MSLLKAFSALVLRRASATIDNFVFHLHYRVTAVMLAAAALLVTSSEHFGKPIVCGPHPPALSEALLDNYCWTRSTFSLIDPKQNQAPYPGVDTVKDGDNVFYHTYYQWVWLVLSIQAAMFYIPRYIWKTIEGGKLHMVVAGLTEPMSDEASRNEQVEKLYKYHGRMSNRRNCWALKYFFCELLNFGNVVAQMFLINSFLGGTFSTYGTRVLRYGFLEQEHRTDSMAVVFPRLTKCMFRAFGPSGNVQIHDAVCVLPLNIINEKIYVILWFWLVLLAIPSGLIIIYRLVLLCCPQLRVKIIHMKHSHVNYVQLERILHRAGIGDWLYLNLLGKNLDEQAFETFVEMSGEVKPGEIKPVKV